jgi:hypothetical protein
MTLKKPLATYVGTLKEIQSGDYVDPSVIENGVPAGGVVGQVVTKISSSDYATGWSTPASIAGAAGYWGSFYDTTNQSASNTTTAYPIGINSTDPNSNGVSIVSGNRITFAYAGIYSIIYSIQFTNSDSNSDIFNIWLEKNGSLVADSNSQFTCSGTAHGGAGALIAVCNYVLTLNAGDYLQLYWQTENTSISITTLSAGTTPTTPVTPAVILTATPVTQIGIGYYGLTSTTSTTIGTGSKTFTTNLSATQTAFTVGTRVRYSYPTNTADFMEGVITAFSGTSMTVNVDSIGGSGTFANWSVSVAGIQGSNGVTSITGTTNQVNVSPAGGTGAVTLSLPQNINSGASPTFNGANFTGIPSASVNYSYATKTSAYTITASDYTIGADATSAGFTVTLPTAVGIPGQAFVIKKIDSSANAVTIGTTSSQTIDGATFYVMGYQYQSVTVQSNGANWLIIGERIVATWQAIK